MAATQAEAKISPKDFRAAANLGDFATVRKYVEQGGDVNVKIPMYDGRTALFDAAYFNYREMLEYLLKHGANPTLYPGAGFEGDSVLRHVVEREYSPEIIKMILDRGGDPNRMSQIIGSTPVTEARSPNVLELLLKAGGDPDAQARYHMKRADEIASLIQNLEAGPRPLPAHFQELWTKYMRMLELFCMYGSTTDSCRDYMAKKEILHEKFEEFTGKNIPENVAGNILRFARGGSRRALRRRKSRRVARKTTRSRVRR